MLVNQTLLGNFRTICNENILLQLVKTHCLELADVLSMFEMYTIFKNICTSFHKNMTLVAAIAIYTELWARL